MIKTHSISDFPPDPRNQRGFTLVELLVAMLIFSIIMALVMIVLIRVSYSAADNMARTSQVKNAELGLMQIDRQVRSGNVILNPANELTAHSDVPAGFSLRVFTQTDGVHQCVQWRVKIDPTTDRGVLEYRSWDPDYTSLGLTPDEWAVVAHDLVPDPAGDPPFTRGGGSDTDEATPSVNVAVFVQAERTRSAPTAVRTTLTGRNTIYGYQIDRCDDVPTP